MKYLVCDLDNTFLDTLQELEKMVEGYKISKQVRYKLEGKELEPFLNGSIYNEVSLNLEVVKTINYYLEKNYQLIFISQTFTDIARHKKRLIINRFANELGYNSFPLVTDDKEIIKYVENLKGEVIFIDDAPKRLRWIERSFPNSLVYKVNYPYNQLAIKNKTKLLNRG